MDVDDDAAGGLSAVAGPASVDGRGADVDDDAAPAAAEGLSTAWSSSQLQLVERASLEDLLIGAGMPRSSLTSLWFLLVRRVIRDSASDPADSTSDQLVSMADS